MILSLVAAGMLISPALAADTVSAPKMIETAEVKRMIDEGRPMELVDVRVPDDYAKRHLVGARNVPFYQIGKIGLPKNRLIVLYCSSQSCSMSTDAARVLIGQGYANVRVLEGGFERGVWGGLASEGSSPLPVRKGPQKISAKELEIRLKEKDPPTLVDLRAPREYRAGHLPQARNIPLEEIRAGEISFSRFSPIIVYDRIAERAAQGAAQLSADGFDVAELEGGIALWSRQKRPLINQ